MERSTRGRHLYVLGALVGAVALGACRGENLFTLTGTVSASVPTVEITAPTNASTVILGDSVLILAGVEAPEGVVTIDFRATYVDSIGGPAYTPETQGGGNAIAVSVTNRLRPVLGQRAGEAYIVVQATDAAGQQGIDSVKVTIN